MPSEQERLVAAYFHTLRSLAKESRDVGAGKVAIALLRRNSVRRWAMVIDGNWLCQVEGEPIEGALRLTLADGAVYRSTERIGGYFVEDETLVIQLPARGEAVDVRIRAALKDFGGRSLYGEEITSFADDIPQSEGGAGPMRMPCTLTRVDG